MIHRLTIYTLLILLLALESVAIGQVDPEQLEEAAIEAAIAKVEPSVIRFETIGGNNRVDGVVVANGPATGLVVTQDGYVISSSFHFAHQPASILARLPDGKKASAEIVGRDLSRKIVLLKVQSKFEFTVPETMKPEELQTGQTVIAIGRVFDAQTPNISTGIVSATNRVWSKSIQTDAKISPANFGGPLTDLRGNVVGILVPMSPDDDGEMAGTQWYDSGIGFAVPISGLLERLEELKSGTPLRAGLLGISLKGTDLYVDKAIVAVCSGTSPAGKAGVQPDDEIVEINGQKITRQSELKHAIGPLYENDTVELVVLRGGKRIPFSVQLAGEIEPYDPPGIGVMLSDDPSKSLTVDAVLEDSPAALAGVEIGDQIKTLNQTQLDDPAELRLKLAASTIDDEVELSVQRKGKDKNLKLKLQRRSAGLFPVGKADQDREARVFEIKVADAANKCFAMVPESLDDELPPALLVWISNPGKLEKESLEKTWLQHCKQHNVAILFPESSDEKRWSPDDANFITSAIENLAKQSPYDSSRVTIGGIKTGGAMASLIAFGRRDLFQGLALIDSMASARIARMETSPVEPLLIFVSGEQNAQSQESVKRFEEANFPVHWEPKEGGFSQRAGTLLGWSKTVNRY